MELNKETDAPREKIGEGRAHPVGNAGRLDSWKDISLYLNRNIRTVQRWETLEAMPVHRHGHVAGASVYGYKDELDAWRVRRSRRKNPIRPKLRKDPTQGQADVLRLAVEMFLKALGKQLTEGTMLPPTS